MKTPVTISATCMRPSEHGYTVTWKSQKWPQAEAVVAAAAAARHTLLPGTNFRLVTITETVDTRRGFHNLELRRAATSQNYSGSPSHQH